MNIPSLGCDRSSVGVPFRELEGVVAEAIDGVCSRYGKNRTPEENEHGTLTEGESISP